MKIKFSKRTNIIWWIFLIVFIVGAINHSYWIITKESLLHSSFTEPIFYYISALTFGTTLNDIEARREVKNSSMLIALVITFLFEIGFLIFLPENLSHGSSLVATFMMVWFFVLFLRTKSRHE